MFKVLDFTLNPTKFSENNNFLSFHYIGQTDCRSEGPCKNSINNVGLHGNKFTRSH